MKNFLVFVSVFLCFQVMASPLPDFPFLTVEGESRQKVKPDIAEVSFEVVTFDKDLSESKSQLNAAVESILLILDEEKISLENLTSMQVVKSLKRAKLRGEYEELEILGYEFAQSFELNLDNLDHYSIIINKMLEIESVTKLYVRFDISNRDEAESNLMVEAGRDAKEKADQMVLGLGVEVDSVFAVTAGNSFHNFFATFGISGRALSRDRAKPIVRGKNPDPFVPEYIELHQSLNVVYRLKD